MSVSPGPFPRWELASPPSAHRPCGWGQKQPLLPWALASGCPCGITPHLPRGSDCCRPALLPAQGFSALWFPRVHRLREPNGEELGEENRPRVANAEAPQEVRGAAAPGLVHTACYLCGQEVGRERRVAPPLTPASRWTRHACVTDISLSCLVCF